MRRRVLWGIVGIGIGMMIALEAEAGPPSRWSDAPGSPSKTIEEVDEELPPLAPVQTPVGPVLAPPPPSPQAAPPPSSYGARISTLPPETGAAPPSPKRGKSSYVPPEPVPGSTTVSPTRSDLPAGWEQPVVLPPGAVTLEKVKSPAAPVSSWPTAGGAAQPPPAAAPAAPEAEEMEEEVEQGAKPPSRWQ